MSDTTRPATKRVRSDNQDKNGDKQDDDAKINQAQPYEIDVEKDKIPEWLSAAPFQVGKDWEGWNKTWRSSCWCGKSEQNLFSEVCGKSYTHLQPPFRSRIILWDPKSATVKTVSDYMVSHLVALY
jgi:hypothetical protein